MNMFEGRLPHNAGASAKVAKLDVIDAAYAAYGAEVRAKAAKRERVFHLNFWDWYQDIYSPVAYKVAA